MQASRTSPTHTKCKTPKNEKNIMKQDQIHKTKQGISSPCSCSKKVILPVQLSLGHSDPRCTRRERPPHVHPTRPL
jgi:hypothetical protein